MKSQSYSHGQIIKVHRDHEGLCFCFVRLDDGRQIFLHEGRHHQLEIAPDRDIVFDPRNRADQNDQFRWSIKPPQEGDLIVCVVFPAVRAHHRSFAHYWAYECDWHELWFVELQRHSEAIYAEQGDMFDLLDPALDLFEDISEVHNSSFSIS